MTHVLIVDDQEESRALLKMLLEANGYRVTAAGDGLEALDAARRDPPDVIVSDALMPKMDGYALCRAWMQDAALRTIPFIFYSATYVRPEDEQLGLALGAVRYLIKPLDQEVFLREMRAMLQQWAGHAAPAPATPLDDATAHALHESALARKIEDKIAQLEAANRKLQESEARFRSLTEMSSDFYWESDAEHRLTQRASAGKKLSTVSVFRQGAQIGEHRWDIPYLSPDAAGWAAHRAVLDAHQPFRHFELSRMGTDGTEHFISISGDPVFDESGAFTGYRGVGKDITEQVRRIDDLLRLRAAMDVTVDSIYLTDPATMRFVEVNSAACRRLGYTREQLLELEPQDVLDADREQLRRVYDEVIAAGEQGTSAEMHYLTSDGRRGWTELHRRALRSGSGWLIVTLGRDITERKQAEDALRKNYELLDRIFATTHFCVVYMDRNFNFVRVNNAYADACGHPPEFFPGKNHFELYPGKKMEAIFRQVVATGKPFTIYANPFEFPDHPEWGVTYWDWTLHPLRSERGDVEALLFTLLDVTERKLAEQALRNSNERLRDLSQRLLETEAADRRNINRELHDRIGGNLSALNLSLNIIRSELGQESLRAVGDRLQGAQRLLEETTVQVRNVMADLHPPALDDFGLQAALRTYVESLVARLAAPITLHGDYPAPRLPLVAEMALFRVAQGALTNAVTHARAKHVQVLLTANPERVTLSIADDGVGFDVAHAVVAHASWGLAIMRERSQAVGAEFRVESAPGKGTRIVVEIPRGGVEGRRARDE